MTTKADVDSKVWDARVSVLAGTLEEVNGQKAIASRLVDIATFIATLNGLQSSLKDLGLNALGTTVQDQVALVTSVQKGTEEFTSLGGVLVTLYKLRLDVGDAVLGLSAVLATPAKTIALDKTLLQCITSARKLLGTRPDVSAVMEDLAAIKDLRGGPADAVAFHDFHSLKLAFKSVWLHAFNTELKSNVERLYALIAGDDIDHSPIPVEIGQDALQDINDLKGLITQVQAGLDVAATNDAGIPEIVRRWFSGAVNWNVMSVAQQSLVAWDAAQLEAMDSVALQSQYAADLTKQGFAQLEAPLGPAGRLSKLIAEISKALNEPYAFDVFAPGTYNFGLMVTHRQEWTPGPYQAGDLVSTIPLAPGESRRFSTRRVVKESRSTKEANKSSQATSWSETSTGRAESEIMHRATSSTNFQMTSGGSFNIGIGSINATSEMGANSQLFDSQSSKDFHEATLKAAEDFRKEHSMEVDASQSSESEATSSGEISNPNNELTCTYLFYELQRRYQIHEYLYRVVPVILVAQDVPAPEEIDEAWLVQYQWILARVLLDESLRPALNYLTSGFAGDEVSVAVLKAGWLAQQRLVAKLEAMVDDQTVMRDSLRETLVRTAERKKITEAYEMPTAAKVLTWGLAFDAAQAEADKLQAENEAAKTRLGYVEQALTDGQKKLTDASAAFFQATQDYTKALQQQFSRHTAIDQLRVHVKQNILFYMQAIYAHEPTDHRFFRLYRKQVICPGTNAGCTPNVVSSRPVPDTMPGVVRSVPKSAAVPAVGVTAAAATAVGAGVAASAGPGAAAGAVTTKLWKADFDYVCVPTFNGGIGGQTHDLCEVADLDNPIGYKGNYIIFPFIDSCTLVDYMIANYVDTELGVMDQNADLQDFNPATFEEQWTAAADDAARNGLKDQLTRYLTAVQRSTDEIIVPTGQLFIEALPGSHPLLEDFKLEHRLMDVMKARAELRRDELENLRYASRLAEAQGQKALLGDPHVDKQVHVTVPGTLPAAP